MGFLDFTQYALWINALVFAGSATVVWFAGTRISGYANTIAERTGIGKALIGLLLLGGVTSLPELAVSVSSSVAGNAALAVNNLLGGVAMQVVVLAVADAAIRRDALSSVIPKPVVLLQATFDVLLLTLVVAAISVGELPLGFSIGTTASVQVGAWTTRVLVVGLAAIGLVQRYERSPA